MADVSSSGDLLSRIEIVSVHQAASREEVLHSLAETAVAAGWARPGYAEALLKREAAYPTGLHTRGIEIAIPHADAEWTLFPAMVVGLLDEPVVFQPMGGQGGDVLARVILLLVIPDAEAHIGFLRAMAGFIEDEQLLQEFGTTRNVDMLIGYLKQELGSGVQ
jgi:PTS system galactitol-specific IIA component